MDTKKAYRMLVVVLFFAFISLISRSIIYLVLSVAIATMIVFLLSSAKKAKREQGVQTSSTKASGDQDIRLHKFLIVTTVIGALMIGYGSLFFTENPYFQQFISIPTQFPLAILIMIGGFGIALSSLYFIIREMLSTGAEKSGDRCEFCRAKNNPEHRYCFKCGKQL
ncbi:hypothetical protein DS745_01260 [Anaerobacillus alkaliphilus]|uniref:Uncharacterized protein n=1 Tax=Anaerobacillus alkaliphilus TaxID=1548597 RepID=A0A4Q0VXY4_9BACI|nr:zinc ribbon domain-containing protein [Anaerobacillus alkaliphilus]RXJ04046.1 hypothetical protein DS745_01260 [Anaerobacillus alkaliphilus]